MRLACAGLPRRFEQTSFEKKQTIITPSPLLAAVASQQFSAFQLSQGVESWERPAIFSINAWLAACWQEVRYNATDIPTLLSPAQERVLWQHIIQQEHPDLFDVDAIAAMARRSAQLIAQWHIPSEGEFWNDSQDTQQFQFWHRQFRSKCQAEGWMARSDLWQLLPKWIVAGHYSPDPVVFTAFSSVTPALEKLKHSLGARALIEPLSLPLPDQVAATKCCTDFKQEIEQAARWARAMFEQQPSRSIGIFVPDLGTHQALVQRTFQQVFYPSAAFHRESRDGSAFHSAASAPLQSHPLIASALLLLELARPRIHQPDASAILRCPFITGAAAERSARALADMRLRRFRELDVSLSQMERAAKECAVLSRMWAGIRQVLRSRSNQVELPAWSRFIGDLLKVVGWPGDAELTSQEQDLIETWKNALSVLASLGLVSGQASFETALAHLRRLLARTGSNTDDWSSPVQILDATHAFGLEFDLAFITGVSDETWPPPMQLSPLVPLKAQRAHGVPGSSQVSEQRERERMTHALFSAAPVLMATYSRRLAPAAQQFVKETTAELPGWVGKLPRQSYTPTSLERIEDYKAPEYHATEETRGGTYIIKAQSQCPFRAFAEIRLNAATLEDACFGLDARERGGLLHKALQLVWQQLQTQARLCSTPNDQLRTLVRQAVAEAVQGDRGSPFHEQNSLAERERLEALIFDWLRIERSRKQPFAVETTEQERSFKIAGLDLRLRIDRVDRVKNGKLVLIDYKSGKPMRNQLQGERPAEPQLLVYAAALGKDVEGIFFGQLKPRDLRGVGFSREKHFLDRTAEVRPDWDLFISESRTHIERIARGFVEGFAAVQPLEHACDYCSMKPLCRVYESNRREQEEQE
jgi:ATP-dependent helicase/nuclease subunit B